MLHMRPARVVVAGGLACVFTLAFPLEAQAATGTVIVGTKDGKSQKITNPQDNACLALVVSDTGTFLGNNTDKKITVYRDSYCKSAINTVAPRASARYNGANQGFHSFKPLR